MGFRRQTMHSSEAQLSTQFLLWPTAGRSPQAEQVGQAYDSAAAEMRGQIAHGKNIDAANLRMSRVVLKPERRIMNVSTQPRNGRTFYDTSSRMVMRHPMGVP